MGTWIGFARLFESIEREQELRGDCDKGATLGTFCAWLAPSDRISYKLLSENGQRSERRRQ